MFGEMLPGHRCGIKRTDEDQPTLAEPRPRHLRAAGSLIDDFKWFDTQSLGESRHRFVQIADDEIDVMRTRRRGFAIARNR